MMCNRIDCPGLKCSGIGVGCGVTEHRLRENNPKEKEQFEPVFYGLDLSSEPDQTAIVLSRAKYINMCDDEKERARREALVGGSDGDIILRFHPGAWKDMSDALKILKDIGVMTDD